MAAVGLAAWWDLRRRRRRLILLFLVVGLVGALALVTAAGARRTSTSLARFKAASRSADVELDGDPTPSQVDQLRRIPGVAALGVLSAFGLIVPAQPQFQQIGVPADDQFGVAVDRDRIVAGRAAHPDVVDEVTIGEALADELHLRVGDHLTVESYTPDQIAAFLRADPDVGPPSGPQVGLHVVGIVRRPLDLGDRGALGGLMVLTPAFGREYGGKVGVFGSRIRILTDHGDADVPAVLAASRAILGDSLFTAQPLGVENQGARSAIDLFASALWIFAAVAALAGAVAIAVVTAREMQLMSDGQDRLGELGCTRSQLVAMAVLPIVVVATGGALLALVGAVVASPIFPLGVARRADPSVGINADWTVLTIGGAAVVAVVLMVAVVASYRSTARPSVDGTPAAGHPSTLAERAAAAGLAPSITIGVRMATESDRRVATSRIRPALLAATGGVLGVTAVLLFASSVDNLVATPRLYGSNWDFATSDITSSIPCGGSDFGLSDDAALIGLAEVCSQNVQLDGHPVSALAFSQLRGEPIEPVMTAGRAPAGPDEIALGSATLRALGKNIGDTVQAGGRNAVLPYRIVGTALFPTLAQAQPLADGAAFTGEGYAPLFDPNIYSRFFVGRFASGADRATVERRIAAVPELTAMTGPALPSELGRLRQISWLPVTLATLIGSLGLLVVGHALVTSVHRRRRELAILKTLGFTRRQVRSSVGWQATTIAAVGLLIGLPAGIIVGSLIWRHVASGLGVATVTSVPLVGLLLVIPGAIALLNLAAVLPARAAARARPGPALRTE